MVTCSTPQGLQRAAQYFRQNEGARHRDFGLYEDVMVGDDFVACVVVALSQDALQRRIEEIERNYGDVSDDI